MNVSFSENYISLQWATLCNSARASATQLSQGCLEATAALMRTQAAHFCDHPTPSTRDQLNAAYTRRMALSARLTAIKRADAMARAHPDVKDRILAETAAFCDGDFPGSGSAFLELQKRNLELTTKIADLCDGAAAARAGNPA